MNDTLARNALLGGVPSSLTNLDKHCGSANLRILVLTKRQYTGRDLLDDRYGRLYEIPAALVRLGNEVQGMAYSFRRRDNSFAMERLDGVCWQSINGWPFSPFSGSRHICKVVQSIRSFRPDVVWASSDAWHAFVARTACRLTNTPYVLDLYDNYESFTLTHLPGARSILRSACRHAIGITAVSHTLQDFICNHYGLGRTPVNVLGNAINPSVYFPHDRIRARQQLQLPLNAILIGTAGALSSSRDIGTLFDAVRLVNEAGRGVQLVVAGPRDKSLNLALHDHVIDLGVLPPTQVPVLFSALDIGVICNKDSDFGRYCYPQKYEEMVACGLQVVAARVGEMENLLSDSPQNLYEPESAKSLAIKIDALLRSDSSSKREASTWIQRAQALEHFLHEVIRPCRH